MTSWRPRQMWRLFHFFPSFLPQNFPVPKSSKLNLSLHDEWRRTTYGFESVLVDASRIRKGQMILHERRRSRLIELFHEERAGNRYNPSNIQAQNSSITAPSTWTISDLWAITNSPRKHHHGSHRHGQVSQVRGRRLRGWELPGRSLINCRQ